MLCRQDVRTQPERLPVTTPPERSGRAGAEIWGRMPVGCTEVIDLL
ncbi:hypothetical protein [Indioceanicola profundi]|nr:hypothetical protein [Indioceanicola profundi]